MKSSLTLKNIYRLLTVQDYPAFGPGIFLSSDLKGLTLYRFWDQILIEELRAGRTGSTLWRQNGPRNRYLSSICNGSCPPGVYKRYFTEIMDQLSPEMLLRQTESFIRFFHVRRSDAMILHDKLERYLSVIRQENPSLSKNAYAYLDDCLRRFSAGEAPDAQGTFFYLSLHLCVLTLLCLTGTERERPDFLAFFSSPFFAPEQIKSLYNRFKTQNEHFRFLTGRSNAADHFGISDLHFFGRENELFELQETLHQAKKNYLICGGAGIGKTELMYQLINACRKEGLPCCAALIHYEDNLTDSLLRSFPFIHAADKVSAVFLLHQYLQEKSKDNLLLFIDNLAKKKEDREELAFLCSLDCRIYATSRNPSLKGFVSFPLQPLTADSCLLIFRDLYTHPLSRHSIMQLRSLFVEKELLHTLTVRMLASAANYHRWTPDQLPAAFDAQDISLLQTSPEGGSLRTVYRNLFRSASPSRAAQHLMSLAASLPARPVTKSAFLSWICTGSAEERELQDALEQLIFQSWIREDARGISIHPLIRAAFTGHSRSWLRNSSTMHSMIRCWRQLGSYGVSEHTLLPGRPEEDLTDLADFLYETASHMKFPLPAAFFDVMTEVMLLQLTTFRSSESDPLLHKMYLQEGLTDIQLMRLISIFLYTRSCPETLLPEAKRLCLQLQAKAEGCSEEEEVFLCLFGKYLVYSNDSRAPGILEPLSRSSNPAVGALSCIVLSGCAQFAMDAEGMLSWLEKGAQCIAGGKLENSNIHLSWMEGYCNYLQASMQAEKLLDHALQLQELAEKLADKNAEWMALYYQGSLLISDPSEAKQGVTMLEKARDIAMSIAQDDFYILFLNKFLAMGYEKTEQFARSEKIYLDSIALLQKYPQRVLDLQQYENNLGVLYQHWGKWDNSLPVLEASLEKALRFDSAISIAEPRNNLSKYYHHIGDFAKEKALLREALPVFESVYGEEHPKTIDVRQRLEEGLE